MKMIIRYIILGFILFLLSNCNNVLTNDNLITGKGTITYRNIEGGFYGIVDNKGKRYIPLNLKSDYPGFAKHDVNVIFVAEKCKNQDSIFMWGTLIKINRIKKN